MDRKTTTFKLNSNFLVLEINDYLKKFEDYTAENHFSMYNQFIILSVKTGSIIIDEKKFCLSDYSLVTLMKNQSHRLDKLSEINGYILLFNENNLFKNDNQLNLSLKLSLFESSIYPKPVSLKENDYKIFKEIFEVLKTDVNRSNSTRTNEIHDNFLLILLKKVLKLKSEFGTVIDGREKALLNQFDFELSKNLMISRCVKYYADSLAVTPKKLNSITKTYFDLTAKEFIEEKIINESKQLLINGSDTIKEISYTMGFTEPTNFNKFFKKHTSKTPQQFRNQYNNFSF